MASASLQEISLVVNLEEKKVFATLSYSSTKIPNVSSQWSDWKWINSIQFSKYSL